MPGGGGGMEGTGVVGTNDPTGSGKKTTAHLAGGWHQELVKGEDELYGRGSDLKSLRQEDTRRPSRKDSVHKQINKDKLQQRSAGSGPEHGRPQQIRAWELNAALAARKKKEEKDEDPKKRTTHGTTE